MSKKQLPPQFQTPEAQAEWYRQESDGAGVYTSAAVEEHAQAEQDAARLEAIQDAIKLHRDQANSRPELIPGAFLLELGKVLAYGAAKHSDWGWKDRSPDSHHGAALRHLCKWPRPGADPETGQSHLIHAVARLMMLWDLTENPYGQ